MCPGRRRTTSGLVLVIFTYRRVLPNVLGRTGMSARKPSSATGKTASVTVASEQCLGTQLVMKVSLASHGRQSTAESPVSLRAVSLTAKQVCRTM
jgi:hypothetical protein